MPSEMLQKNMDEITSILIDNECELISFEKGRRVKYTCSCKNIAETDSSNIRRKGLDGCAKCSKQKCNQEIKNFIRESDGYINLSQICKAGNKFYKDWFRLEKTKKFLTELSKELKLDILTDKTRKGKSGYVGGLIEINQYNSGKVGCLIEINMGKSNVNDQSTWGHPYVANNIAQWVSAKFSVKVSLWIDEWKNISEINSKKYVVSLENIEPDNNNSCVEKDIQNRLYKELGGEMEVYTNFGYIDLLTDTELIEIKVGNNWKHGLGQLLAYRKFYLNHSLRLHLFDIEHQTDISDWCKEYNVLVTYEK